MHTHRIILAALVAASAVRGIAAPVWSIAETKSDKRREDDGERVTVIYVKAVRPDHRTPYRMQIDVQARDATSIRAASMDGGRGGTYGIAHNPVWYARWFVRVRTSGMKAPEISWRVRILDPDTGDVLASASRGIKDEAKWDTENLVADALDIGLTHGSEPQ